MADEPSMFAGTPAEDTPAAGTAAVPNRAASASTAPGDDPPSMFAGTPEEAKAQDTAAPPAPQTTWRGVAKNFAAGLLDAAGNVGNVLTDPVGNLIGKPLATTAVFLHDAVGPALGYPAYTDQQRNDLLSDNVPQPGTALINATGRAIGADPGAVAAATPAERLTRKVVGAAGTGAALGPAGLAAPAIAGVSAAAGDQAANYAPDYAKPMVELGTNLATAGVGAKVAATATRATNLAAGNQSPIVQAYDRLGIEPSLRGDVTGNDSAQMAQAYSSAAPFSSGVVRPVEQRVVGQFGQAVEDTAAKLGSSTNAQAAGDVLQSEARNWKDTVFPQRQDQAWAPVDQAMGNATVDPSNYRTALTALTGKLAALPETQKALLPPRIQQMLDAINTDVPQGSTMSWGQAQQLRSAIGNVMGVPEIAQSVGKDQLKAAYSGISQDMKASASDSAASSAAAGTPNHADEAFANANKVSTEGHAFIDNHLSKIIRSNNPAQETITPERAAQTVLGSGDTTIQAIRREMPKAADELAAYKLRDMATATPGLAGPSGNEVSPGTFLTDLNRFRQGAPGGHAALYGNDPAVAQRVDDLATVAGTIKDTAKKANTSKTGPFMALGQAAPSMAAGYYAAGIPGAIGAVATPFALNRAMGHVVTNQAMTRFAAAPGPTAPVNPLGMGLLSDTESQRLSAPPLNYLLAPER
jgi:hypothetical protein